MAPTKLTRRQARMNPADLIQTIDIDIDTEPLQVRRLIRQLAGRFCFTRCWC